MRAPIDASMKADDYERQNPAAENRGLDTVSKDERSRRSLPSSAGRSRCRLCRAARFMLEEGQAQNGKRFKKVGLTLYLISREPAPD
jgi:hypothetical protein